MGVREVDDDSLLVVVGVSDVRELAFCHYEDSIGLGEIFGHPTLARVPDFVVVPADMELSGTSGLASN